MAVTRVEREEEEEERLMSLGGGKQKHLKKVVRQGWMQAPLTFLGLLLPIAAFRGMLLLPKSSPPLPLPMCLRAAAGLLSALSWEGFAMERKLPGGGRWFTYILVTVLTGIGDVLVMWGHSADMKGLQLQPLSVLVLAPFLGLVGAAGDMVWPWFCYKQGMIDSAHPPTPLSGEVDLYASPYSVAPETSPMIGHSLVLVRLVNMMVVAPLMETLFFRGFIFAQIESVVHNGAVSCLIVGGLWSTHKMNYHGEVFLRLSFGVAVCLVSWRFPGQSLTLFFLALATRNFVASVRAIVRRKWYMWVI
eukprot:766922-Hanusia_phi.AAC.1